ncbi:IS4 family transposase [Rhodococcus ruber]|uniref:IS4 family transposase n=1 Tax=Rhodococcus ruber TaxID=1830 RepID=UPI00193175AB|nr:IS4 family transposase [Rhodococcus ruber]
MDTQSVTTGSITVAGGRFAPGHLGELTQHLPFEMVDEALVATGAMQSRVRDLPSRVVVYLLLAACLFPEVGYCGVWRKLTAGLGGIDTAAPTAGALAQARRRVGVTPLHWLFDLLRGPAPTGTDRRGTRWHGLLVCAIDGTVLTVPDTAAILTRFTKNGGNHGGTGYPQARVVALLACGTRTLIDAVFGPTTVGETTYTARLLRSLRPGMIVLADRNFGAKALIADIAGTGAEALVRLKSGRRMPVLTRYRDGSYLSTLGTLRVRVIDCEVTVVTAAGRRTGVYRLATTLLDPHRHPASELIGLYHERWEIETAYLELKSSILGGRVLRARTPVGVEQEIYALLVVYQLLRTAIADATGIVGDLDPDRASFTIAWQAARDQVVHATNVIAGEVVDLVGAIGRHVLAGLMPARRLRACPRIVKRAISKYQARGSHIDRTSYRATMAIEILTGEPPGQHTTATN